MGPLQAARAGGQLGDSQAAGGVDEQRGVLDFQGRVPQAPELQGVDLALTQTVAGDAGHFSEQTHGELLGRHFQREEGHDAAGDGLLGAVRLRLPGVVAGDVERHVTGERGLTHRRTRRQDQQVGGVQAADLAVEVGQAG